LGQQIVRNAIPVGYSASVLCGLIAEIVARLR